jgi:uncharacterized protein YndB with AHSA1/START domain
MTMTSTNETEIIVDPDVPMVRIVREFDAPAAKVFRAHVDPELLVQWNGPRDIEARIVEWDCRTGGSWRYVHARGDEEYAFHGSFHDVLPESNTIVQTFTFDGVPEGVALERIVVEELPGGRCRLTGTSLVDSFEARDAFVASGMETGVREGYERLDTLLALS